MYYPNKEFDKVTFYSIQQPCLNFASCKVTCSPVHRIPCTPDAINRLNQLLNYISWRQPDPFASIPSKMKVVGKLLEISAENTPTMPWWCSQAWFSVKTF